MSPGAGVSIEILDGDRATALREQLAAVLVDCVEGGASISFMSPFGMADALRWWNGIVAAVAAGTTVLFGAFRAGEVVGSVQLGLDMPPNQPHRADIRKLIVRRSARGLGAGRALMEAAEAEARRRGLSLLVLDTASPAADHIYRSLGWTELGVIPNYALLPQGDLCDTTVFWKAL